MRTHGHSVRFGLASATMLFAAAACHNSGVERAGSLWSRVGSYVYTFAVDGVEYRGHFTVELDSVYMHGPCLPSARQTRSLERPPGRVREFFPCRSSVWLRVDPQNPRATSWWRIMTVAKGTPRCFATQVVRGRTVCAKMDTIYTYRSTWVANPVQVRRTEALP